MKTIKIIELGAFSQINCGLTLKVLLYGFILPCLIFTGISCAVNQNARYNLLLDTENDGTKIFAFVVEESLIKEAGGNEKSIINSLLQTELAKIHYCQNGYVITYRGVTQGGGYILYKARCADTRIPSSNH